MPNSIAKAHRRVPNGDSAATRNGKWIYFGDYDAYNLKSKPAQSKWGKAFKLSDDYKTYCWIKDDGYNNFSSWTK